MENMNEKTAILDVLRSHDCVNTFQRIVSDCLDVKIKEIMAVSGLSEIEVLCRLRGQPAAGF